METQALITLEEILAQENNSYVCNYKFSGESELLKTPTGAIGIKSAKELEEISRLESRNILNLDHIGLIYWPDFLSNFILAKGIGNSHIRRFLNRRLRIIIPEVEWFCRKNKYLQERTLKLSKRKIIPNFFNWVFSDHSFHQRTTRNDDFYAWLTRILNNHNEPEFRELVSYSIGSLTNQEKYGTSVLFPPIPLIMNQNGLEIGFNFWNLSRNQYFASGPDFSGITRPIGMLLTLDHKFFKQKNSLFNNCLTYLEELLPEFNPEMILLRPLRTNENNYSSSESSKLRNFLDVIINYGRTNNKPTGVIDCECFSRLSIVGGTDVAGVRLDGRQQTSSGGSGYVPPENRKVWSQAQLEFMQFHDFVRNGPIIPHLPQLSRSMQRHLQLPVSVSIQSKIKHISIAEGLSNEISQIRDSIINGNIRAYENRVLQTAISNQAQHFLQIPL